MTTTRTPEYSIARIIKPFPKFEEKYQGLDPAVNPIAIPGVLDDLAGTPGYDPNLLGGVPVPMGAKVYMWLPKYFPGGYGGSALSYRYRFVWRLRSLSEQNADSDNQTTGHFGRRLPGIPQEPSTSGNPEIVNNLNPTAGPRFVIPAAFESVQIVNNKFFITEVAGVAQPVQHGTINTAGQPINARGQDPADIAVVAARTNTYVNPTEQYQAPLSPKYPGPVALSRKQGAAGLLSQGFYSDQAGWATSGNVQNQGYSAGGLYLLYETECKGDDLIILLDRDPALDAGVNPLWDFSGVDRNVSRILGTDAGTRPALPTLGIYIVTGSGVSPGQSYG